MGGFVAIVNTDGTPFDRELLESLTDTLRFRGPDRQQIWIDGNVGLGQALFKTTDEAEFEAQPASLEGDIWITGSARIDARQELLNKLGLQSEIRLEKTPDSTLILHADRAWGERCVEHLLLDADPRVLCFICSARRDRKISFCDSFLYSGSSVQTDAGDTALCAAPAGLLAP